MFLVTLFSYSATFGVKRDARLMFFIGPGTYLIEPPRVIEKVLEFLVLDHAKKKNHSVDIKKFPSE